MSQERIEKYARKFLSYLYSEYIQDKKVVFMPILAGMPPYMLCDGGEGHNYVTVIDTIHTMSSEEEYPLMREALQDGIHTMIRMSTSFQNIDDVMRVIMYELFYENSTADSFKINWDYIIPVLNSKFQELDAELAGDADYVYWHKMAKEKMIEKYGIEIL